MTLVQQILIATGVFGLAVLFLRRLDRWHARKAWRDAEREAREFMRRHYR